MKNNKIKIVVDTNIFINAFIFPDDYPNDVDCWERIFNLINDEMAELVFSQDTIGELLYIMKNKVLNYIYDEVERVSILNSIVTMFLYSYSVNTERTIAPKCNDKKDDMFLKCAVQGRASYIISNDFKSGMHDIDGLNVYSSEGFNQIDIA